MVDEGGRKFGSEVVYTIFFVTVVASSLFQTSNTLEDNNIASEKNLHAWTQHVPSNYAKNSQQVFSFPRGLATTNDRNKRLDIFEKYKLFYTSVGMHVRNHDVIQDAFLRAVDYEAAEKSKKVTQLRKTIEENPPDSVLIMDRLWSALKFGELPKAATSTANNHPTLTSYFNVIKEDIHDGSFVEIGNGITAFHVAKSNTTYTVAAVLPSGILPLVVDLFETEIHHNFYPTSLPTEDLHTTIEYLYNDEHVLFNHLLLSNLTSLMGDLLPHEFEELIARLISLARTTYVADIETEDRRLIGFFKNSWFRIQDLLTKACDIAGIKCVISQVNGYSTTWNSGSNLLKVSVIQGSRNLPENVCDQYRPGMACMLTFNSSNFPVSLMFSDGSKSQAPAFPATIPFHALIKLGPTDFTRQQLFVQLVSLPYQAFTSSNSMWIHGTDIMSLASIAQQNGDNVNHHPLAQSRVTDNYEYDDGDLEDDKNEELYYNNNNDNNVRKPDVEKQKEHSDTVAKSQLDGVAQRWDRVKNEEKLANLHSEKDEVKSMSQQWDRENTGSKNGDNPLKIKAEKDLKNVHETWNREGADYVQQVEKNDDEVLTKDEHDLKKAMGFLHGNNEEITAKSQQVKHKIENKNKPAVSRLGDDEYVNKIGRNFEQHGQVPRPNLKKDMGDIGQVPRPALNKPINDVGPVGKDKGVLLPPKAVEVKKHSTGKLYFEEKDPFIGDKLEHNQKGVMEKEMDSEKKENKNKMVFGDKYVQQQKEPDQNQVPQHSQINVNPNIDPFKKDNQDSYDIDNHNPELQQFDNQNQKLQNDDGKQLLPNVDNHNQDSQGIDNHQEPQKENNIHNPKNFDNQERQSQNIKPDVQKIRNPRKQYRKSDSLNQNIKNDMKNMKQDQGYRKDGGGDVDNFFNEDIEDYKRKLLHVHTKTMRKLLVNGEEIPKPSISVRDSWAQNRELLRHRQEALRNMHKKQLSAKNIVPYKHPVPAKVLGSKPTSNTVKETVTKIEKVSHTTDYNRNQYAEQAIGGNPVQNGMLDEYTEDLDDSRDDNYEYSVSTQPAVIENTGYVYQVFGPHLKEENLYDKEWKLLMKDFKQASGLEKNYFSVFTYGSEQQSLLGAKIAHTFPHSNVLSVMPRGRLDKLNYHRNILSSINVDNILLVSDLKPDVVLKLTKMPEIFKFQILGIDVFSSLIPLGQGFLYYLGSLLTMAHITYIEVPSPQQLELANNLLGSGMKQQAVFKGMIHEALALVNAEPAEIVLLDDIKLSSPSYTMVNKMVKVTLRKVQREVFVDCQNTKAVLELSSQGSSSLHIADQVIPLSRSMEAFGLEMLLEIGLKPQERKKLFRHFLQLPLYNDMCPSHIVWFNHSLVYHPADSKRSVLLSYSDADRSAEHLVTAQLLSQQLEVNPFSFLEYNSREGDVIYNLAKAYPKSTFVSLTNERADAQALYHRITEHNITNVVVNKIDLDDTLSEKLMESPDFLRYQYLDLLQLTDMIVSMNRANFNHMIGQIIATGVTTFIQVPSEKIMSLAFTVFFPEAFTGKPWQPKNQEQQTLYESQAHPLPLYRGAELKLIGESAQAQVLINVSASVLSPGQSKGGMYSWKILRVDTRNLTVTVNHHFDYALDGHDRKYTLRCISNTSHYEVYLTRVMDGFKIPYGNVHAISLIALLRMGLVEEMKNKFYEMFLKLPYYEDMAPWNIVFRNGQLEYIDYDTKDFTFNKMVPAAYQVMAMLMNYERTVNDFGKCNGHGQNPYGFPYISHCVGSSYEGPCKDSRYPVACGDHTCKPTYIECLKALSELEKKKSIWIQKLVSEMKKPNFEFKEEHLPPYVSGKWSFNEDGAQDPETGKNINTPSKKPESKYNYFSFNKKY